MKKILLIIALTLCIFQMIVLGAVITIGNTASDRSSGSSTSRRTYISKDGQATASGTITTVEIWAVQQMADVEVAIFTEGTSNVFSTRDYETVNNGNGAGVVLAGSKQTFTVDLTVETGDYIGITWSGGQLEMDTSGGTGIWSYSADQIPCTDVTFGSYGSYIFSLYGEGATAGEEDNAIFFGFNF